MSDEFDAMNREEKMSLLLKGCVESKDKHILCRKPKKVIETVRYKYLLIVKLNIILQFL